MGYANAKNKKKYKPKRNNPILNYGKDNPFFNIKEYFTIILRKNLSIKYL